MTVYFVFARRTQNYTEGNGSRGDILPLIQFTIWSRELSSRHQDAQALQDGPSTGELVFLDSWLVPISPSPTGEL